MNRVLRVAAVAWLASALIWSPACSAERDEAPAVKNIIIMISDGCGHRHVEAADLFTHGRPGASVYEQFPCVLSMKTDMLVETPGGVEEVGYDPWLAWSDFRYVARGATDSAAAATAMSTGYKTTGRAIGVSPEGAPLTHLLERCEELGMATGVVTSVPLSHATPAGFVAHNGYRNNYAQIAREMILGSEIDCIMGCGHPYYDDSGERAEDEATNFDYVGGKGVWDYLVDGSAGAWMAPLCDPNGNGRPDPGEWMDADHNGRADDAWTLVQSRAEFQKLMHGKTPKRVIGVAQIRSTLQQDRSGDRHVEPFAVPLVESVPTLAEMTAASLNVLDDDPDGLFVMIEGGAVDWASHENQGARMIEEQCDFNAAVEVVVQWVEDNSSWDETILIVTADHECGHLTAGRRVPSFEPLENNGRGRMPGMTWNSGSHTNSLVPFYAKGALSARLDDYVIGADPHFGRYLDNTAMARMLFAALGAPRPEAVGAPAAAPNM